MRFLHNWSWNRTRVEAPVDCRDVLIGKDIPAGTTIDLSEWDVRVLVEDKVDARR